MRHYDEYEDQEQEQFDLHSVEHIHSSDWFDEIEDVQVDFDMDDNYNAQEH